MVEEQKLFRVQLEARLPCCSSEELNEQPPTFLLLLHLGLVLETVLATEKVEERISRARTGLGFVDEVAFLVWESSGSDARGQENTVWVRVVVMLSKVTTDDVDRLFAVDEFCGQVHQSGDLGGRRDAKLSKVVGGDERSLEVGEGGDSTLRQCRGGVGRQGRKAERRSGEQVAAASSGTSRKLTLSRNRTVVTCREKRTNVRGSSPAAHCASGPRSSCCN